MGNFYKTEAIQHNEMPLERREETMHTYTWAQVSKKSWEKAFCIGGGFYDAK